MASFASNSILNSGMELLDLMMLSLDFWCAWIQIDLEEITKIWKDSNDGPCGTNSLVVIRLLFGNREDWYVRLTTPMLSRFCEAL
jgi:hypothetical protein